MADIFRGFIGILLGLPAPTRGVAPGRIFGFVGLGVGWTVFLGTLRLLIVPLLFAAELPHLRQVVGLPLLRVPFPRVRGCHPLSAMAVGNFDKFVLCPIALRILDGFRVVPRVVHR